MGSPFAHISTVLSQYPHFFNPPIINNWDPQDPAKLHRPGVSPAVILIGKP